ncbi:probable ubiquitin conjugation factor E4 isoform X2 [Prunus avium]|uniref:Probable ubiquitin conjugation factor E4 isoform X2 n=1 Tax=Prunus avium TaxID=42229 RepID=A0A6P5SHU2_PRUAV|nr:probable ubiquitin conjugation factor E4 isoform X2 [Prunus avium]
MEANGCHWIFHQLFSAAVDVLRRIGEDGRVTQEFIELGAKGKVAASEGMDTEAALGDIPDEFLDPIQYTFMKDPVILPSSIITSDPFNRSHLTADMLYQQ